MDYIAIDKDIRFGKPCIKGTRITVADILQWLASGMTYQVIQAGFPPKIIILRTGNISTRFLIEVLLDHKQEIEQFTESEELGILEIY